MKMHKMDYFEILNKPTKGPLCGVWLADPYKCLTDHSEAVTCKRCLRIMAKEKK